MSASSTGHKLVQAGVVDVQRTTADCASQGAVEGVGQVAVQAASLNKEQGVVDDVTQDGPQAGLGVDIVEIERMALILKRTPSFAKKVFSESEQAYCNKHARPEIHYACRFAAKEAVVKTLGTGFSQGVGMQDVEVVKNALGRPKVRLLGKAKELADKLGVIDIPISLSYTATEAVAVAFAITQRTEALKEAKKDPTLELTRKFKEARAWLDDPAV